MEADFALGCLSVVLAFVAACSLGMAVAARVSHGRVAAASSATSQTGGGYVAWRVRNGYAALKPLAGLLLKVPRVRVFVNGVVWLLADRGSASTCESLLSVCVAAVAAIAVVAGVATASLLGGAAVAACAVAIAVAGARTALEKRAAAMREAVPEALRAMGVCFQAGLSLLQTFQQAAAEMQEPMKSLFARGAHMLETGRTASETLAVFRDGSAVSEFAFVAVALDVQHQTGGSMSRVLDSARDAVEGELDLERSLRVQTAQAKLSARIVSIMPLVLVTMFSLVNENFLAPFFSSFTGMALLVVALAMQVAGVLAVRRLLKVEVA